MKEPLSIEQGQIGLLGHVLKAQGEFARACAAFDAFLILEDPAGKKLAENDDIDPGVNTNARLVFQAPKTAVYRLVATGFEQRGSGRTR